MAELVDAQVSGICGRKVVEVRVFFWAPTYRSLLRMFTGFGVIWSSDWFTCQITPTPSSPTVRFNRSSASTFGACVLFPYAAFSALHARSGPKKLVLSMNSAFCANKWREPHHMSETKGAAFMCNTTAGCGDRPPPAFDAATSPCKLDHAERAGLVCAISAARQECVYL